MLSLVPGTEEMPGSCLLDKHIVHLGNSRMESEACEGQGTGNRA